jgi:hypothetical protein
MITFDGFEHILMAVIRRTAHENKHLTDEQRFDSAMSAIFGEQYEKWHEDPPAGFNIGEVIAVQNLMASPKMTWVKAVRMVKGFGPKSKDPEKRKLDGEVTRLADQIKKATKRKAAFYKNFSSIDSDWDLEPNQYEDKDEMRIRLQNRNAIFAALRNAGWPV